MKRLRRWLLWLAGVFVLGSVAAVLLWRWLPPPTSAVMLQRTLVERQLQNYRWVPLGAISPHLALAVVAAEDQRFPDHVGFDVAAIRDAVSDYVNGGRMRGASTLTQQVARNLFLWQGRSFVRKGLEAWFAALLEMLWPKRRILETYLNIAEMGPRTFGAEAASQRYFRGPARDLDAQQAALLAAVLPNPVRLRVEAPSAYLRERQAWILRQMRQLGGVAYLQPIMGAR